VQTNLLDTFTPRLFNIRFNIILPSALRAHFSQELPSGSLTKILYAFAILP
jgi:hypothetical protein